MNAKSNLCTIALAVGMLSGLSAQAGSGLIKVTHACPPYRGEYQGVSRPAARVQPIVKSAPNEVQVAVVALVPAQPAARRSVFIHR
jgi:hypothetical protein